jgi:hypothetical protein
MAVATELKNEEIRVQNVKIAGKGKSLNEFFLQFPKLQNLEVGENYDTKTIFLAMLVVDFHRMRDLQG